MEEEKSTRDKVGTVLVYAAGILFAFSWWLLIDAAVYPGFALNAEGITSPRIIAASSIPAFSWIFLILGSIALCLINVVSWQDLNGSVFSSGASSRARLWLFVWLVVLFSAVIAFIWIATAGFFTAIPPPATQWPGVALLLSAICLLLSAIFYRFARPAEDDAVM